MSFILTTKLRKQTGYIFDRDLYDSRHEERTLNARVTNESSNQPAHLQSEQIFRCLLTLLFEFVEERRSITKPYQFKYIENFTSKK